MKTRNKIALGVALAAVAALVAWSLQPRPVAVEVAEVKLGPGLHVAEGTGGRYFRATDGAALSRIFDDY